MTPLRVSFILLEMVPEKIFYNHMFNNKKLSKDAGKYGHGLGNPLFIAERFGFYFRHFQQHYKINIFNQKIVKNYKMIFNQNFKNDKLTKNNRLKFWLNIILIIFYNFLIEYIYFIVLLKMAEVKAETFSYE